MFVPGRKAIFASEFLYKLVLCYA